MAVTRPTEDKGALGRRIHAARLRRGFTRTVLAAFCGVSEQVVYGWEAGRAMPARQHSSRLALGLGVPWDAFTAGEASWDQHLQRITKVNGPNVFAPPTQWASEGAPDESLTPYRAKEEVGPPEAERPPPPAAPPRRPRPDAPPPRIRLASPSATEQFLAAAWTCRTCGGRRTVLTNVCLTCDMDAE